MRKKTFYSLAALLFVFSLCDANDLLTGSTTQTGGQMQIQKQKELNTIQDYNSMVEDLKQGAILGDPDSNFYLGFVYFNGVTLKDGTIIKPNLIDGAKLLLNAISLGSNKALSVLAAKSIETFDVSTLSEAVKTAQKSEGIRVEDKDYYSLVLASLILDRDSNDANAIEIATKWIYEAEKKRPTSKMQYILASMYAKLQNINAANYYLNKSCLDPQMSSLCQQFKNDANGAKNEETCQKP